MKRKAKYLDPRGDSDPVVFIFIPGLQHLLQHPLAPWRGETAVSLHPNLIPSLSVSIMELKIWFEKIIIGKFSLDSSKFFSIVHSRVYLNKTAIKN